MKRFAGFLALAGLAACSTPGIDYAARVVPENRAAVETRTVDVGRFSGPGGRWYEGRFADMLASATFDGRPWFRMARYTDGTVPEGERAGIYEGLIEVTEYTAEEYTQTVRKCVEWDGLFDCEHRDDVEEICLRENVEVAVTPRLIEYGSGQVLFQQTYFGESSNESCEESYWHSRRGRHSGGSYVYGLLGGVQPPRDMVLDALSDTIYEVRADIAPMNTTRRAVFIEEAVDPVVRADPRFEQAVDAGPKSPDFSCYVWEDLKAEYPEAPAVTHNLGACLEAQGNYVGAHGAYAEAAQLSAAMNGTGQPGEKYSEALSRMSWYRSGLQLIDRLTAPNEGWQPVPQPEAPEAGEAGS
ncbi:hypothetical protein [Henriciella sp.]|uniref:hypothetical protein n=1 Tax=Henriciella sp. TaxID=1968823 RepID=UPI00260F8F16|nr:hypothetical protein [Henriciella sp.]